MTTRFWLILSLASLAAGPGLAQSKAAAIIEDLDAKVKGVELLEYVDPGRRIDTGGGTVVVNYLASCLRETVTGGTLVIGTSESQVSGGKAVREHVKCEGGKLALTESQSSKSGAMAFRGKPKPTGRATLPPAQITIYGASPIITLSAPADVVRIERLDATEAELDLKPAKGRVDLAKLGKRLDPGGLYRATAGTAEIVFLVDAGAAPGAGPAVARLLRL